MHVQVVESEDILGQVTVSKVVAQQPAERGHSGQVLRVPSGAGVKLPRLRREAGLGVLVSWELWKLSAQSRNPL